MRIAAKETINIPGGGLEEGAMMLRCVVDRKLAAYVDGARDSTIPTDGLYSAALYEDAC